MWWIRMLFHSLESSDLPFFGVKTHFSEIGFRKAPPTLALVLTTVACRIEAQNFSLGKGRYFTDL